MNAEFLKKVRLFQGLNYEQLAEILMLGMVKEYQQGAVIFEEGGKGDRLYVIYSGSIRISKIYQPAAEEALTILGPGDFLGEMSFFDEEPRSARAVASLDVQLLEIGNADLRKHLESRPDVAIGFLSAFCETLSQRVRETNQKFSALFAISRVF